MRTLLVQHDHVSPPGPIGERLSERGHDIETLQVIDESTFEDPRIDVVFPDPAQYDAIVVMGARWSAYDHDLIGGWVLPEVDMLRAADGVGVPVLGICFGGQLLASAHGGSVQSAPEPELGWVDLETDDPGMVPEGPWLAWHFDRWSLPSGAVEVARNGSASQAFTLRRNLAVQFHPEATPEMLEGWLRNGGEAQLVALGLNPEAMVARTRRQAPIARAQAHRLVDAFVDRVSRAPGGGSEKPGRNG